MKLLVLGSNGQLGAELMARGAAAGHQVLGLARDQLDVTVTASCETAIDTATPEVVINTTAFHVVPECEREPVAAFAVNAAAVQILARICRERGIGFLTYSTDYVFDGLKGEPNHEDDPPRPLQTYGVSKYAGELLSALSHPGSLVVRTCGVFGGAGGSRSRRGNFVLSILAAAAQRAEIEVSSEQIVNPTYAADLATATLELLGRRPEGGLYHLAAEGHCSWAEFATEIVSSTGRSARIVPVDHGGRSGTLRRPLFSALANHRARALGITLPHWREGLKRYLATLASVTRG